MHPIRIRPRSSIADPELARTAVVDLPSAPEPSRLRVPRALAEAITSLRGAVEHEPERVIVLTLVPVPARRR
jgi:acetyl esterase/lipase